MPVPTLSRPVPVPTLSRPVPVPTQSRSVPVPTQYRADARTDDGVANLGDEAVLRVGLEEVEDFGRLPEPEEVGPAAVAKDALAELVHLVEVVDDHLADDDIDFALGHRLGRRGRCGSNGGGGRRSSRSARAPPRRPARGAACSRLGGLGRISGGSGGGTSGSGGRGRWLGQVAGHVDVVDGVAEPELFEKVACHPIVGGGVAQDHADAVLALHERADAIVQLRP